MEEQVTRSGATPQTAPWIERAKHHLYARGVTLAADGNLNFKSDREQEVIQRIVDAHTQSFQGSFRPDRENDQLTLALGTKEHPGRTRGKGVVPWKEGFPKFAESYRSRKRRREELEDLLAVVRQELVQERQMTDAKIREIKESFQQGIRQQQGEENVVSPGGRRSSCASAGFGEEELARFPVDDITESKVCKLVVPTMNITITVAMG